LRLVDLFLRWLRTARGEDQEQGSNHQQASHRREV
jgi:hypothetical protein